MRPPRRENPIVDCPITAATTAIGGKWRLIVIYWLGEAPCHFAALRSRMYGISQKVLTEQLRALESEGIVRREATGPHPAPVMYSLTPYGRGAVPVMRAMMAWGEAHIERFRDGARVA